MKKFLSVLFIFMCFTGIGFSEYILPIKNIVSSSASFEFLKTPKSVLPWKGNVTFHYIPVYWFENGEQLPTFKGILNNDGFNSGLNYLIVEFSYTIDDNRSLNQKYYFPQRDLYRLFSISRSLDENAYITMNAPTVTTVFRKNADPEVRSELQSYKIYVKNGMMFFDLDTTNIADRLSFNRDVLRRVYEILLSRTQY